MKVPVRNICEDCYNSTGKDTVTYRKITQNGVVVGFIEVSICQDCGEEYITNIFSDGNIDLEILATELGFREDFEDDDEYDEFDFDDEDENEEKYVSSNGTVFRFIDGVLVSCSNK